jgi:hypothetical protein
MRHNPGDGGNSLYLVPLRNGLPLSSKNSSNGAIAVLNRGHTIVGRLELMSSLYAACGCHNKIFSTKQKCDECQSVNQWALVALSRQMLRIRKGNLLSIRGGHAFVVISGPTGQYSTVSCSNEEIHVTKQPNEWRGEQQISPGMTISVRELDGEGRLDFVVAANVPEELPFRNRSTDKESREAELQVGEYDSSAVAKVDDEALDKNTAIACGEEGIYVYFCPLGQDLSRHRLGILSKEAALRGASVVSDYLKATHIVISKQVGSLEAVADYLGEPKEKLDQHLHAVSRTTFS